MAEIATTPADCFFLGLDAFMRRRGQGAHVGVSVVELRGSPDIKTLGSAIARIGESYPITSAASRWSAKSWCPVWKTGAEVNLPLEISFAPNHPAPPKTGARVYPDLTALIEHLLASPCPIDQAVPHLGFHLYQESEDRVYLVISWHHAILDGIGVNHLLRALATDGRAAPADDTPAPTPEASGGFKAMAPALRYLRGLDGKGIGSCGAPRAEAGPQRSEVITFDEEQSAAMLEHLRPLGGELALSPILLSAVARAHLAALRHRGEDPRALVALAPMQPSKKMQKSRPLFQNHLSSAILLLSPDDLSELGGAVGIVQRRLAPFAFGELPTSMAAMLRVMRHVPRRLYLAMPRLHFRGRFASFFQSYTGEFAEGVTQLFGAEVLNGYNVPAVSSPPGTGIFFSTCRGRFSITLSWREAALSPEERQAMTRSLLADLCGE